MWIGMDYILGGESSLLDEWDGEEKRARQREERRSSMLDWNETQTQWGQDRERERDDRRGKGEGGRRKERGSDGWQKKARKG